MPWVEGGGIWQPFFPLEQRLLSPRVCPAASWFPCILPSSCCSWGDWMSSWLFCLWIQQLQTMQGIADSIQILQPRRFSPFQISLHLYFAFNVRICTFHFSLFAFYAFSYYVEMQQISTFWYTLCTSPFHFQNPPLTDKGHVPSRKGTCDALLSLT